jgi:hypothetical protein
MLQVTRELEKDIALAKQQLAQASNSKVERAQQYKLMLRTLDCVTRWGKMLLFCVCRQCDSARCM